MEITRHFTATTIIVCGDKVLLHLHKKINRWLPVGGHLDRDEIPDKAAVREVKEETGLDVKLHNFNELLFFQDAQMLIKPYCILLEDINSYHQHIDFIYFATSDTLDIKPESGHIDDFRWFTVDELDSLDAPDNVIHLAKVALTALT
jgi:8-oxo-dGTP pyrophosphatase MutT (NUDIX family)